MRVLVIEEDLVACRPLIQALRNDGAIVDHLESGEEALEMARHYDYDIVVLDLMLRDMDGYEVVRCMRAARIDTPVLVTSALGRPQARVKAFALGADDFLRKPYDVSECVARMQEILRRSKGYSQPMLRVGDVQLSLATREVSVANKPVHLTSREYSVLELLVMRKGMVLTKEVFLNHLYSGVDEPEAKFIDWLVCKLRKKLAQAGAPDIIGTVWGRGYTIREPLGMHALLSDEAFEGEFVDDGYCPLISPSRALAVLLGQVGDGQGTRPAGGMAASLIVKPRSVA